MSITMPDGRTYTYLSDGLMAQDHVVALADTPLVDRVDVGGAGSQGDRCADRVMRARDGVLLLDPSGPADPEHRVALHGRLLPPRIRRLPSDSTHEAILIILRCT